MCLLDLQVNGLVCIFWIAFWEVFVWYLYVLYQASTHLQNGFPCIITFIVNYYDLKSGLF